MRNMRIKNHAHVAQNNDVHYVRELLPLAFRQLNHYAICHFLAGGFRYVSEPRVSDLNRFDHHSEPITGESQSASQRSEQADGTGRHQIEWKYGVRQHRQPIFEDGHGVTNDHTNRIQTDTIRHGRCHRTGRSSLYDFR